MKYFCGVHVSCGDWKKTGEEAREDWNRRVKEYLENAKESKLKSCPFCGYEAVLEGVKVRKGYETIARCNGCLAIIRTITYDTEEEAKQKAIEAWNRRA